MKKFLLFLAVNLLVHLPFMQLPPSGTHVWRQCNTLAMSRNFAEEDMNIFTPRIDRRNETNGITGSHFPLYEWLLAAVSKVFGFSDTLARYYSLIIFTFSMLAFYALLRHFNVAETMAMAGSLLLLSIPELYYHSINAMPDNLALCLSLFSLLWWLRYLKAQKSKYLLLALLSGLLCGLIKFQFLLIPLSALVFVPLKVKDLLRYSAVWIAIAMPVVAWYQYALTLTRMNNLKEYGLWIKPVAFSQKMQTLWSNLSMDLPEVLTGWPFFIALLILLFRYLKKTGITPVLRFAALWLLMFAAFYVVAIERMQQHAYYFIPLLPLFVFVFILIWKKFNFRIQWLYLVLILNFSWAFLRIIPSRWVEAKSQIPHEFYDPELRKAFAEVLPPNTKCVTGPDISGCIYFYFTHTKGYSFEHTEELLTIKEGKSDIENMRAAGVKYLIIRDGRLLQPFMDRLNLKRKVKTIGDFEVWEL